jgi:small-conductance mechanosensitive channel
MATPADERPRFEFQPPSTHRSSDEEGTVYERDLRQDGSVDSSALRERLRVEVTRDPLRYDDYQPSPSQTREEASRLKDELEMQRAEKMVSNIEQSMEPRASATLSRSRSRVADPIDDFDAATNPLHERAAVYKPPENPTTKVARFFKYIHESSWLVRYFTYIVPVTVLLLTPVFIAIFTTPGQVADVGSVELLWFGIWLQIVWLTLWAGRIIAKCVPWPLGLLASLFTNNSKKWRDFGKQLEIPLTLFLWWLAIEISFTTIMPHHRVNGQSGDPDWYGTANKVIVSLFVGMVLNLVEKIIIQLIAISFHLRTYADRIDVNKFQIGSLTKLYIYSKAKIDVEDHEFREKDAKIPSGAHTPSAYIGMAAKAAQKTVAKVGDVAGAVAGDFTGQKIEKSGHPSQVILSLLRSTGGSQVLARRLYRTFAREGEETVSSEDLKAAFDNEDEADAAFSMFDKDMNGDISMEELEAVCVEIGRERKAITASLKDLDSVVSKLDDVLMFIVLVIVALVFISLISTSAAGVLTSAGSAVLALSWLFSATAQEFLQSIVFVFVKHPFDVGDRVSIYGNTGAQLKGDDYFVKEISLLYTEFKKMEGQIVQAPNSYLNTLFILNMRRSGGLAEAVPVVIRFGTTLEQIESLRNTLLEFVRSEKREYQNNILTELREVTEAYSLTLNVVFFYKSNWQNELLRLQRRNKFICALMMAMQQHGIEGPYRNNAGYHVDRPMYLQYPGPPPSYNGQGNSNDPSHAPSEQAIDPNTQQPIERSNPSILRRRTSRGQLGRPRGESITAMAKRVDFSLGMKNIAAGDDMADVYDDQKDTRYRNVIREANRIDEERRSSEVTSGVDSEGRSTSRKRSGSTALQAPTAHGGLFRRSTDLMSRETQQHRGSVSSMGTMHRNRFLERFGTTRGRGSFERVRDVEEGAAGVSGQGQQQQGPIDPRSGQVTSQAVRMDSENSVLPEPVGGAELRPMASRAEDWEMRRLAAQQQQKDQ